MKKYLLIALLIMAGSVIVGNTSNQQDCEKYTVEINRISENDEVEFKVEDQIDDHGTYLGTVIVIYNHLNSAVYVKTVFTENGKKNFVVNYVPAKGKKTAWYGNRTLKVIRKESYWDNSPIDVDVDFDDF